jgi:tetratricopeptide (TPR) repeat protein
LSQVATTLLWLGGDDGTADALIERALALNPGASLPWFASAWIKVFDGRPELAIEQWERHLLLDPRSRHYAFVAGGMGIALALLGRFDDAVTRLREALHVAPDHRGLQIMLVVALAHVGQVEEARRRAATLPADVISNRLGPFRRKADRDLCRDSLRLAGVVVEG